jgi:hypothetical protein
MNPLVVAKRSATIPHWSLLLPTLEETTGAVKPETDEIFNYNRDLRWLS